jgi:ribosome biogenesis GTPase
MDIVKKGRVLSCVGGLYTVEVWNGDVRGEVQCRARGIFRHSNQSPLVGDLVEIDTSGGEENAVIGAICDRKNSLIRPPLANLERVFVTMASSSPKPMLDMTDKLTAILEHNDIEPVIVVGKCELDPEYASVLKGIYEKSGYDVFVLSCATGDGISEIEEYIKNLPKGSISAFAGASGVGKSTLMNRLFPHLELGTGGVSRKTERGRHTTRAVTLFPIENGAYLADTPGFSMLDFERFDFFDLEELPMCFKEINERIGECRYTKCTHRKEDGCSIVEAVARGDIAKSRHDSYLTLYDILKNKNKWN